MSRFFGLWLASIMWGILGCYSAPANDRSAAPSVGEVIYYHIARTFDLFCASQWAPKRLFQAYYSEIPLASYTSEYPGRRLFLGMQPNDHLAQQLLQRAARAGKKLYVLSILMPFEAKYTSKLIPDDALVLINAKDNQALPMATMDAGINKLEALLQREQAMVYVHCKSGLGRSAAVVAGWLGKRGNLSVGAATQAIKILRPRSTIDQGENEHHRALLRWAEANQIP